jgi:PAS domain S-box-containing protein
MEDLDILGLSLEKALQKAALLRENRLYREKLEGLVEKRTHDLRESESRFRRLADNARDLIWRIKIPEGNIEYASPASRRILGFTPEELYEDHTLLLNSLREEDRPSFREFWESVKRGDPPETLEICMVAASGEPRWIYQSNVLVTDESGVPLALEAICTDITERKRIESEREALIADLKAKNGELELFTYTVSHDLRSPLVTIRGFADGLKEDLASGDMGRVGEDVQRIISAAEKMNLLLRDLLELSRVGRIMNSSSEIFLPELIGEVRELLHAEISGSGAVIELREPLPVVRGDFPRIREVFQNLIENAIKFTSRGETPRILIGSERRNGEEVIYVRDKGIGIDPSQRERIFGLFQKIDRNQPGTGLGLALARRIIEVHGGRIWVESPGEGGGATFCLTIPVKAGPARVFFRDGFS